MTAPTPGRHGLHPAVTVEALAWAAAVAAYVGMRLIALFSVPVGGLELWSLSGAWQAQAGLDDGRYVPTAAQAVTSALLAVRDDEVLPRLAAFGASLAVPVLLFFLRDRLGRAPALLTLLLLAFDPIQVATGATATAAAFDLPIALGLVLLCRFLHRRPLLLAPAGLAVAVSGPLPFLVSAALLGLALARGARVTYRGAGAAALGAAAGILLASLGFGAGWQGVTVPPFDLVAAGPTAPWSTESTRRLFLLYAWAPTLVAAAGLAWAAARALLGRPARPGRALDGSLAAWFLLAVGWTVAVGGSRDPLPLAALGAAAALLAGRKLADVVDCLPSVDWRRAGWPLAGASLALVTLAGPLLDWARLGRIGPVTEVAAAVALGSVVVGAVGLLLLAPSTRPAALLPFLVAGALPWLAGGFAVATGSPNEPLPSPVTTLRASELRDIATGPARDPGGLVVVHPSLADALTWPLRGTRGVVAASRVPPNASIVIWPAAEASPGGEFRVFEGRWAVLQERRGPEPGVLPYLRWLGHRNILPVSDVLAAVYAREAQ